MFKIQHADYVIIKLELSVKLTYTPVIVLSFKINLQMFEGFLSPTSVIMLLNRIPRYNMITEKKPWIYRWIMKNKKYLAKIDVSEVDLYPNIYMRFVGFFITTKCYHTLKQNFRRYNMITEKS